MGNLKLYLGQSTIKRTKSCNDCGQAILPEASGPLESKDYYEAALKDYQQAVKLDDQFGEAYYQLGQTHQLLGNKEKACVKYQQAAALKYALAKKQIVDFCSSK